MGDKTDFYGNQPVGEQFVEEMRREGFQIDLFDYSVHFPKPDDTTERFLKRYDAVIYVLSEGTSSNQTTVRLSWNLLADELGIPFDRERNNLLRGVSRMVSLEIILEKANKSYTDKEKAAFAEKKNEICRKLLDRKSPADLSKEVKSTLEALHRLDWRLAIGLSSKNTPFILERIGLDNFFDIVVDGNCITYSKPNPEVFLKAAASLEIKPEECIVVEDACVGIDAAKAGGMGTIGIGEAATYHKTDYPIRDFCEILNVVKRD